MLSRAVLAADPPRPADQCPTLATPAQHHHIRAAHCHRRLSGNRRATRRETCDDDKPMPTPPPDSKTSLRERLQSRAQTRWPDLDVVTVRYRGAFAYISGELPDGDTLPLCRLR